MGNEFVRGVSGGERKRVNIGMELILDPPVLFLDEPTTGLDANTANQIVLLLYKFVFFIYLYLYVIINHRCNQILYKFVMLQFDLVCVESDYCMREFILNLNDSVIVVYICDVIITFFGLFLQLNSFQ